jgi:hypothetical protein
VLGSLGTQFGRFLEPQVLGPVSVSKNEIGIGIFILFLFFGNGEKIQTQNQKFL